MLEGSTQDVEFCVRCMRAWFGYVSVGEMVRDVRSYGPGQVCEFLFREVLTVMGVQEYVMFVLGMRSV